MKFAKLEEGNLIYAPRPLIVDGLHIFTDDLATHLAMGYKEVALTDEPEVTEGYYSTFVWEETQNQIVQTWVQEPIPEPTISEVDLALQEMGVQVYAE